MRRRQGLLPGFWSGKRGLSNSYGAHCSKCFAERTLIVVAELLLAGFLGVSLVWYFILSGLREGRPLVLRDDPNLTGHFSAEKVEWMLGARSRNRGFQKKTGMVDPQYWMAEHSEYRKSQLWSWIDEPGTSHPPTPFPHCQVYINHDYRFIWVKGYKVGSTAMRGSLGWLCDDNWWVPEDADRSRCSKPMWKNASLTVDQAQEWWREYFVFGVVRNPLTRFSSGYEYISERMPEQCPVPDLSEACRDPYVFAKTCRLTDCCNNSTIDHHVRHFGDQSRCLFSAVDTPAVDFIAETESLDDDLRSIVATVNDRRPAGLPPLALTPSYSNPGPGAQWKKPEERRRQRVAALRRDPECVPELVRIYRNDYATLGYGDT